MHTDREAEFRGTLDALRKELAARQVRLPSEPYRSDPYHVAPIQPLIYLVDEGASTLWWTQRMRLHGIALQADNADTPSLLPSMPPRQESYDASEAQYKEEIERRDQQIAAIEAMGKEREQWRETVFDRRVKDAMQPCLDAQAALEAQVAELRAERDAARQGEDAAAAKVSTSNPYLIPI